MPQCFEFAGSLGIRVRWLLSVVCAAGISIGTGAELPAAAAPLHSFVRVSQAWARWLPGDLPAGGYVTLINEGDRPRRLIGVSSPDYALIEIHRSVIQNGNSRMEPVAGIEIPPHASLSFAATGYHLMLEQPRRELHQGDMVTLRLDFDDGAHLTTRMPLRSPGAGADVPQLPHSSK